MWKATLDIKDATAKGGCCRDILATGLDRQAADDMAERAAEAHAATEDHNLRPVQTFPGRTFIYCECGACFHVAQGR